MCVFGVGGWGWGLQTRLLLALSAPINTPSCHQNQPKRSVQHPVVTGIITYWTTGLPICSENIPLLVHHLQLIILS